jgi:hypothetical protein
MRESSDLIIDVLVDMIEATQKIQKRSIDTSYATSSKAVHSICT